MKSSKLLFVVTGFALLAGMSSGAFANDKWIGDETYSLQSHFKSTDNRADANGDLKQAQAQRGYVTGGQEFTPPDAGFVSTKTRAQVIAELKQAQADGSYVALQEEYEGQFSAPSGDTGSRLAAQGDVTNLN